MVKLAESYPFGDKKNLTVEDLLKIIEDMYKDLSVAINKKPDVYERSDDGKTSDISLSNGDININTVSGKIEMLAKHTDPTVPSNPPTVVWKTLS